jgi:hypothetical protein
MTEIDSSTVQLPQGCQLVTPPDSNPKAMVSGSSSLQVNSNQVNSTVFSISGSSTASIQGNNLEGINVIAPTGGGVAFTLSGRAQYTLLADLSLSSSGLSSIGSSIHLDLCGSPGCIVSTNAGVGGSGTIVVTSGSFPHVSQSGVLDPGNYYVRVGASPIIFNGPNIFNGLGSSTANFTAVLSITPLQAPSCKVTDAVSFKQFDPRWASNPYDNSYETTTPYPTQLSPVSLSGKLTLTDGINSCPVNLPLSFQTLGLNYPNNLIGLGNYVREFCQPNMSAGKPIQVAPSKGTTWYQSLYDTRCISSFCPRSQPNDTVQNPLQLLDSNNNNIIKPKTIGEEGCALTCLAMAISTAFSTVNPPPPVIMPNELNDFMSNALVIPGGVFKDDGGVDWSNTVNKVAVSTGTPLQYFEESGRSSVARQTAHVYATLDKYLCSANPVPVIVASNSTLPVRLVTLCS